MLHRAIVLFTLIFALATVAVVVIATSLPWWLVADALGFQALPLWMLAALALVVFAYIVSAEFAKSMFCARLHRKQADRHAGHGNS